MGQFSSLDPSLLDAWFYEFWLWILHKCGALDRVCKLLQLLGSAAGLMKPSIKDPEFSDDFLF